MKNRIPGIILAIVICAAALWLLLHAEVWDRSMRSFESRLDPINTTIPEGVRQRAFLDNDPYYWLTYAGEMIEHGKWRIRYTHADNPPDGRPVHWSQSISWIMVFYGSIRKMITGQPWQGAIEDAAIWINPSLALLMMGLSAYLLAIRLGVIPAIAWTAPFLIIGDIVWAFHPLRPDHQSLHVLFSSSSALMLALGGLGWINPKPSQPQQKFVFWKNVEPPDFMTAQRLMIASGVAGGFGFWTGASVQLMTMGAVMAAGIYLVMNMPTSNSAFNYRPTLWRWWGISGAVTSLLMYCVEYAGDWPGMRLEVNSPFHAIGWVCTAEFMTRLARKRLDGETSPGVIALMIFLIVGAILTPLALTFGPSSWHALHDVHMQRLHNFINEFYTYSNFIQQERLFRIWASYGFLPLLMIAAVWMSGSSWSTTYEWALLWMGFALTITMGILSWYQIRWLPFFAAALLSLIPVILAILNRVGRLRRAWSLAAAILFLSLLGWAGLQAQRQWTEAIAIQKKPNAVVQEVTMAVLKKNFALLIGKSNTNGSMRVLAEPDLAGPLYYFGGIPSVTSYYWENNDGLSVATTFLSAIEDAGARSVALERGLTHVILPQGTDIPDMFQFIRDGYFDKGLSRNTLAGRITAGKPPLWLKIDRDLTKAGHTRYRVGGGPGTVFGTITVLAIQPDNLIPQSLP